MRLKEKMLKFTQETAKNNSMPILAVPKIEKVVLNVGVGQYKDSKEALESIEKQLIQVCGQKPKKTQAKLSISGFKVREGQHVGYAVTLRGNRMWDFIERLNTVVLARSREFDGIDLKSMDKNNNLTFAIKDQLVFPEIKPDDVKVSWGMAISLSVKNAQNKDLVVDMLKAAGFVFK